MAQLSVKTHGCDVNKRFNILLAAFFVSMCCGLVDAQMTDTNDAASVAASGAMLNKGSTAMCPARCGSYAGGADATNLLVCQTWGNGRGSNSQRAKEGAVCMPAYNCRDDWNPCVQWNDNTVGKTVADQTGLAGDAPYNNLKNADKGRAACQDITSLTLQNTGSASGAPAGGWKPTSLGWHMGDGHLRCGWAATYQGIAPDGYPNDDLLLEDFGSVTINGISDVVDCCVKAMEYEGTPMEKGGKAIRFDVKNNVCRIDREIMMRSNLDTSSGLSMNYLVPCGDDGDRFYWRHAAGGADGASLGSAGSCAARFGFTKVTNTDSFLPMGRIPQPGPEMPNSAVNMCHNSAHAEYDKAKCDIAARYNTISDTEGCCEACVNNLWLPDADTDGYQCAAFQIVHGKCRILREKYFTNKFGSDGLGRYSGIGNTAKTITETIEMCATGNSECERSDDSHGHWASCSETASDTTDLCKFYSFMYYRDRDASTNKFPTEDATRTIPSYVSFDVFTPAELSGGMDIEIDASLAANRSSTKEVVKAPDSSAGSSSVYGASKGSTSAGYNSTNPACVRLSLYESDPDSAAGGFLNDVGGTFAMDPENTTEASKKVVAQSNLCCPAADGSGCKLKLEFTAAQAQDASYGVGRRLLAAAQSGKNLVLAYECEGTGGDVCDMKQAKYDVPKLGVAYMAPVSAANDAGLGAVIALVVAAVLAMLQ